MTEQADQPGLLTRPQIERRERDTLAAYACRSADSRGRRHGEPEHPYRSVYQRDRDRVIHCTAFRRLQYKTQVFVNHEGDHYRTRLTHTLEVAQISRTMARALRLNEDLAEAVALAHDLGHTAFGHSGEEALDELLAGHGGFEHNRHTIRIVDLLEHPYPDWPGLNLAHETRECLAKHRTRYDRPVCPEFPLTEQPPLEGQIVDLADSIAYNSHDLDDALAAGLIDEPACEQLELWRLLRDRVVADHPRPGQLTEQARKIRVVKTLIEAMVTDALGQTIRDLGERGVAGLEDVRAAGRPLVAFSPAMAGQVRQVEQFLWDRVYGHHRVVRMSRRAKMFIQRLFAEFAADPRQLPPAYQARVAGDGLPQVVADYIAGMTDRFCQDEYKRLFEPFERT